MSLWTKPCFRGLSIGPGIRFVWWFSVFFNHESNRTVSGCLVGWRYVLSAEEHLYTLEVLFPLFLRMLEQTVCETVSTFSALYFKCLYFWVSTSDLRTLCCCVYCDGLFWRIDVQSKKLITSGWIFDWPYMSYKLFAVCCFMNGCFESVLL